MSTPLNVTVASLGQHLAAAEAILKDHVYEDSGAQIVTNWNQLPLVASLIGTESEYAERIRGPKTPVARTLLLGGGLWAWISYHEEWESARQAGSTRRFAFRFAGLTIHFGYRNNQHKPQICRAEWAIDEGRCGRGNPANPHWHFDALESLKRDETEQRATGILTTLRKKEGEAEPRDFSPPVKQKDVQDVVSVQKMSKLHFASAAAWWKGASASHVQDPTSLRDIQIWVKETLEHLREELGRLATSR